VGTLNGAQAPTPTAAETDERLGITAADCTVDKLGTTIPVEKIGEPVRRVTLAAPSWTAETATAPAYCRTWMASSISDRHGRHRASIQLRRGAARALEPQIRADGRRRP
jgi:hypothetical protein